MELEHGMERLDAAMKLAGIDTTSEEYLDFIGWRRQLHDSIENTRRYSVSSPSEIDRQERIMRELDKLALRHTGSSFRDLCKSRAKYGSPAKVVTDSTGDLQDGESSRTQRPFTPSTSSSINNDQAKSQQGRDVVSLPSQPIINSGKAWAVLVGVNHYEDQYINDLKVCVADVAAIQQSLDKSYEIAHLLTDVTAERLPTRANILGELSTVAQSTAEGDLLLFYFSGHGIAEAGESYLLPRDTRITALKYTAINMHEVREIMDKSPARAKVIVLDACHSGASIGKATLVMTEEFIRRVFEEAEGMAVLASCKQGQKSWEWPEQGRSVFTYYLLEALTGKADFDQKGFVTVADASRYVTDSVKRWAVERCVPQTPTLQYTATGDIVLIRPA